MKKCILFSALALVLALPSIAQQQRHGLAQQPAHLTPELSKQLSDQGIQPPPAMQSYNLTDSSYNYEYLRDVGEWHCVSKHYSTNDCDLGRVLFTLDKVEAANGEFETTGKDEWSYYPDGVTKTYHFYNWNPIAGTWLLTYERLYNEAGQITSALDYYYDTNSDWALTSGGRSTLVYDSEGHLVLQLEEAYDIALAVFVPRSRRVFNYDNGLLTMETLDGFFGGDWVPNYRINYTYDAEGKLISSLNEKYFQGIWSVSEQSSFSYNADGLLVLELVEGTGGSKRKFETTYHPNDQPDRVQEYEWVSELQDWVTTNSTAQDEAGYFIEYTWKYNYSPTTNTYFGGFRLFYTLNHNASIDKIIAQSLEAQTLDTWVNYDSVQHTYDANGRLEENIGHRWDADINEFYYSYRYQYFNTGCLFNESQETVAVQPACTLANPMELGQPVHCPSLKADSNYRLELFSMTGARVHSQPFQSGQTVTAQGLVPGIYLLAISNGQAVVQRTKVVVQ